MRLVKHCSLGRLLYRNSSMLLDSLISLLVPRILLQNGSSSKEALRVSLVVVRKLSFLLLNSKKFSDVLRCLPKDSILSHFPLALPKGRSSWTTGLSVRSLIRLSMFVVRTLFNATFMDGRRVLFSLLLNHSSCILLSLILERYSICDSLLLDQAFVLSSCHSWLRCWIDNINGSRLTHRLQDTILIYFNSLARLKTVLLECFWLINLMIVKYRLLLLTEYFRRWIKWVFWFVEILGSNHWACLFESIIDIHTRGQCIMVDPLHAQRCSIRAECDLRNLFVWTRRLKSSLIVALFNYLTREFFLLSILHVSEPLDDNFLVSVCRRL